MGGTPTSDTGGPAQHQLLCEITRILELITKDASPRELFATMLESLLRLTASDYGYIGEVFVDEQPWLRTWAVTDVSWNSETRQLYQDLVVHGQGLEFRRLDTLFGWGLLDGGQIVLSNDPVHDPRRGGRPGGHPPLDSFLAIPVQHGGQLIGQMAVANRPGGYDHALVDTLTPFTTAVASVLERTRLDRERQDAVRLTETQRRQGRALARHMQEAVSIVGADGKLRHVIGGTMLGLDRQQGMPRSTDHLVHPDDRVRLAGAFRDIRETGAAQHLLSRFTDVDGATRTLELTVQDMRDDPDINGIVVTSHDVTTVIQAEQQAEQTAHELTTLVAGLRDGVLFIDRDRRVIYVNDRFRELWGCLDESTFLGGGETSPDRNLLAADLRDPRTGPGGVIADPDTVVESIQEVYARQAPRLGVRIGRLDGLVVECDYLPVCRDGAVVGHIWVHRDVTESVRAEQAREHELERAAAQNRSLQDLHRLKTEFIAMVSHELATPVTSVVNFAELVDERLRAGGDTAEAGEYVAILQRNARRLLRLVDDLLAIAMLDAGAARLHYETVDFAELVGNVLVGFGPELDTTSITLHTELEAGAATLDPERVEQVVKNLLTNAIKFTGTHGTITVGVRRAGSDDPVAACGDDRAADGWELTVRDDGIGIGDEDIAHLSEPFYRGANATVAHIPGSGLGLAVVRSITARHGGRLTIHRLAVGTEARVWLPGRPLQPAADLLEH